MGDQLTKCQPARKTGGKEFAAGNTGRQLVEAAQEHKQASTPRHAHNPAAMENETPALTSGHNAVDEEFQRQKEKVRTHSENKCTLSESLYCHTGTGISGHLERKLKYHAQSLILYTWTGKEKIVMFFPSAS